MKSIKKDNFGFSLIEIIIVIAIMSVVMGVASYGLSLSSGKPAEECAKKLESALSHARTTTMGKYRNQVTVSDTGSNIEVNEVIAIEIDDTGNVTNSNTRQTVVGTNKVEVTYSIDGGGYASLPSGGLTLRFDSGTGALKEPEVSDRLIFKVRKANTTKYVIITKLTGRVTTSETDAAEVIPSSDFGESESAASGLDS